MFAEKAENNLKAEFLKKIAEFKKSKNLKIRKSRILKDFSRIF
jgi:hypothetical protein